MDVTEQEPETVPAELPADVAAPAPADSDLDSLLAQFDAATAKPDADTVTGDNLSPDQVGQGTAAPDFDQRLQELLGPDPRIGQLESEINSLRSQEIERKSRADFEGFSCKLQAELGPNVDDQFARTNLLAMAAENPALEMVWQHRHITDQQIAAADREFKELEALHFRLVNQPDGDPRKQAAIQQLELRGQQLGYMLNARTILNKVWRDVQKRASRVLPAIDPIATADRDAVAFARAGLRHNRALKSCSTAPAAPHKLFGGSNDYTS